MDSSNQQSQFQSLGELTITEDGVYDVNQMPPSLPELNYDYYLLRHGQSWGNVEGVISSARALATSEKHGLTPLGEEQSRESSKNLLQFLRERNDTDNKDETTTKPRRVFFYSSPFARAKQTAQCCINGLLDSDKSEIIQQLQLDLQTEIIIEHGIMERFFGDLDDKALSTYAYVWPVDKVDVTNTGYNVESVAAICTRMYKTLQKIDTHERHQEGDIIVLVSHADTLQILQVYAAGLDNVGDFSSYRFTNGEVRELGQSVDCLPDPQPLEMPDDLPEI